MRGLALFNKLDGVGGGAEAVVRGGPWLGPLRLELEVGAGAAAQSTGPTRQARRAAGAGHFTVHVQAFYFC